MEFIEEPNRIYAKDAEGAVIAEITFPERRAGVVEIDRTFVSDTLRGQGVAGELMQACYDRLRADGKKAVPTCSYAVRWFESHPQEADVLAGEK